MSMDECGNGGKAPESFYKYYMPLDPIEPDTGLPSLTVEGYDLPVSYPHPPSRKCAVWTGTPIDDNDIMHVDLLMKAIMKGKEGI